MSKRRKDHGPNKLGTWEYVEPSFSHGSVRDSRTVNSGKTVKKRFFRVLTDSTERTQRIRSDIVQRSVVNDLPTVALFHV